MVEIVDTMDREMNGDVVEVLDNEGSEGGERGGLCHHGGCGGLRGYHSASCSCKDINSFPHSHYDLSEIAPLTVNG